MSAIGSIIAELQPREMGYLGDAHKLQDPIIRLSQIVQAEQSRTTALQAEAASLRANSGEFIRVINSLHEFRTETEKQMAAQNTAIGNLETTLKSRVEVLESENEQLRTEMSKMREMLLASMRETETRLSALLDDRVTVLSSSVTGLQR